MMESLAESFAEGGVWMYPIALLGCAGLPAALALFAVGATSRKNLAWPFGLGLVIAGLLPAALGYVAYTLNWANVMEAVAHVSPEDRETILMGGKSECLTTVEAGLGASIFPLCFGLALLGIAVARRGLSQPTPTR